MPTARTKSSTAPWSWTTTVRDCSRPGCGTVTRCTSATWSRRDPVSRYSASTKAKVRRSHSAHQAWRSTTRRRGKSCGACCPVRMSVAGWLPTSIRDRPATNSGAPPHPGFFLGEGMADPPRPRIVHRDTQPPAFKTLTASVTTLWPPNHRMVSVSLDAALVDLLDPSPTARILGVSSNEPVDGADDGSTAPDWEITGPLRVNLRAERSGTGTDRIYSIQVEGRDAAGNTTLQTVSVSVTSGPVGLSQPFRGTPGWRARSRSSPGASRQRRCPRP